MANELPIIKPLIVIKTGTVTKADISRLRKSGLCAIESSDPQAIRYLEPPPLGYGEQEAAAIKLFRHVMSVSQEWNRITLSRKYVEILIEGGPLDPLKKLEKLKN
jgi:hypothetical protein